MKSQVKLPSPAQVYDANNEAQTRRLLAEEDFRNVKSSDRASATEYGIVKVDGTSITATTDGTISANGVSFAVTASEDIAAGAIVSLFHSGAVMRARNANATDATRPAHAFVTAAISSGDSGIAHGGAAILAGLSGLSQGSIYYLDTANGGITTSLPVASGNIAQEVGVAISATQLLFYPKTPASNPTALAGPVAIPGNATSFMRSDGAPAIQPGNATQAGIVMSADPTATGGPAAVNGTAVTYMRSDASPAIQKASASQFGIVEVDGVTITATGGVISAAGGGASGADPTATAGPVAINGTATTFLRSDGAPAVQKASASQFGIVEVDGTTITASSGVISAVGGGVIGAFDLLWFGDGNDGTVMISSGTTTLTRDMFYAALTISGTGVLATNGYRVFVSGTLDLSAAPAGAMQFNGKAGSGSSSGARPGATTGASLASSANGGGGGAVGTGNGTAGGSSTQVAAVFGGTCGSAGTGGTGTGHTGGASGTATASNDFIDIRSLQPVLGAYFLNGLNNYIMAAGGNSAPGGGGGAGDGSNVGGQGGGGGSGAGVMDIAAHTIARGTNSNAGIIQAMGGNGGNGSNPSLGNTGGGGGGSGGAGGYVRIIWHTLTGSTISGAVDVSGGAGGHGGNAVGTGTGGDGGSAGGYGRVDLYDIGTPAQTMNAAGTSLAGNAHVTTTGGLAKAATVQQVSL